MIVDSMKLFVTVIEHRNFSRAAEELFLSQPGVSVQIRNLEKEFGTKLIHRTPKYVEPTQAGEILYAKAKQILEYYESAKEDIKLLKNIVTGTLKIGASFTIGEYLLPHLLGEYARLYPEVKIQITIANTEQIAQAVRQAQIDIGLIEGEISYSDLQVEPFMEDKMLLVVPKDHPLSFYKEIPPNKLNDQVWILRELGSGTRAFSDHLISEFNLRVKHSLVFGSNQGVKESVLAGLGIALVSHLIVQKELMADELKALTIQGEKSTRLFSIIKPKEPTISKAMQVFLDKLRNSKSVIIK